MNNLSWLLYLADVFSSLGALTTFLSVVFGVACVAVSIIGCMVFSEGEGRTDEDKRAWKAIVLFIFPAFFLSALTSVVLPSKETMYAIAASEMGEEVLNSRVGTKATKALEAWLDRQMGDEKEEASNDS